MENQQLQWGLDDLIKLKDLKGQTLVIKYGGSIMDRTEAQTAFIGDLQLLSAMGVRLVIVHGGGPEISKWLSKTGVESKFINGLRVTDEATMEIVEMVLSGNVNKKLSFNLSIQGLTAVGLSGKDSGLITVKKKLIEEEDGEIDLGFVGEVTGINTMLLTKLLEIGLIPVISPIGTDSSGSSYNVNADSAAAFISSALKADLLLVMTDIDGVYLDIKNPATRLKTITVDEIDLYTKQGIITGGMLPKLECCISALAGGTGGVRLIDGRREHGLLVELITGSGTKFIFEREDASCQENM